MTTIGCKPEVRSDTRGWKNGSMSKIFVAQTWRPEFKSPEPTQKPGPVTYTNNSIAASQWLTPIIPLLHLWRQEYPWGFPASQPSWIDKLRVQWERLFQKLRWKMIEEATHAHTYEHVYTYLNMLAYTKWCYVALSSEVSLLLVIVRCPGIHWLWKQGSATENLIGSRSNHLITMTTAAVILWDDVTSLDNLHL